QSARLSSLSASPEVAMANVIKSCRESANEPVRPYQEAVYGTRRSDARNARPSRQRRSLHRRRRPASMTHQPTRLALWCLRLGLTALQKTSRPLTIALRGATA